MMRRRLGWIAIGWMLTVCLVTILAFGNPRGRPSLQDRTRAIALQLRCPICHGESVADSPSGIARSIRALIRRRLAEGQSPDAIKRYLVSRYGTGIELAPPGSGVGDIAWLAPPLLLLGGLALLFALIAGWRSPGAKSTAGRAEYVDRVRAELASDVAGE